MLTLNLVLPTYASAGIVMVLLMVPRDPELVFSGRTCSPGSLKFPLLLKSIHAVQFSGTKLAALNDKEYEPEPYAPLVRSKMGGCKLLKNLYPPSSPDALVIVPSCTKSIQSAENDAPLQGQSSAR